MKKYLLGLSILLCTTGCMNITNASYEQIIAESIANNYATTNEFRSGYLYYLPKGIRTIKKEGNNEILAHENNYYYLYVDTVSYYNKVKSEYQPKENALYSQKIENKENFGYIEIKKTAKNEYFIEIMYNYAKIEVIVPEDEAKETIAYSLSILSSIKYQDTVLKSLMEESALKSSEIEYNIFETANTESGYLQITEEYGQYQESEENVDPDFIRR